MNPSPRNMYPQIYLVDRGGLQTTMTDSGLVPCWSFPPAVVKTKKRGSGGAFALIVIVLVLFLILAALGLGTYQILRLQSELRQLREVVNERPKLQRQISVPETNVDKREIKRAAHLIARIEKDMSPTRRWDALHWYSKHGQAFTIGVDYQDGGIQINETGLYFVYSRVEFLDSHCPVTATLKHTVFRRRTGTEPRNLLEGHRVGFCQPVPGRPWSSSSYLGAVLQLNRLDRVFVDVSHPHLLSKHHNANFFGLCKL